MRVAIVGGGISGLSTAFYIRQLRPDAQVCLFEKAPFLGGTMHTEQVEGFLFETGSNGFLSNKPDTLALAKASDAESILLRSSDTARLRYIYTDRLHRLPDNPLAFMRSSLLSLRGKLRVLGEFFVPPRHEDSDETLQSFGCRRVGREFTDVFLNAMAAGIYASTPEMLSVSAAFPAVVRLERDFGGLFRGMLKQRKKQAGPGGVLMSFRGGVSTFVDHLGKVIDGQIALGKEVLAVERQAGKYQVQTEEASVEVDKVVLATPAHVSAKLLQQLDPAIAARLNVIDYSPIAVVGLGYGALDHPLNGFGLLTTASAGKEILGVLWDSSIFPDRAPSGKKALRVMIGGQRNPELALRSEDELIATAMKGVRETMAVNDTPQVTFVKRWDRGIPNYKRGHLAHVKEIFERLREIPGLFLNSNAYFGIGLNDCVASSRRCAEKVCAE